MAQVIIQVKKGGVCNCQQVQPATNTNTDMVTSSSMQKVLPTGTIAPAALNRAAQTAAALPAPSPAPPASSVKIKWWPYALAAAGVGLLVLLLSGSDKKKKKNAKK